jgi:predicted transcriptional regulator
VAGGCERNFKKLESEDSESYTFGMKTAVSIPDDLFEEAERLAQRTKRSRSRVFSEALREYVARHLPDGVIEEINQACGEIGQPEENVFTASAARTTLERSKW